jgi:AraC-like DNA-binding protein
MFVETAQGSWVVPPHRAVWLPAGAPHAITMRGSVAMRTIYFSKRVRPALGATTVVNVTPLLRELLLHCASLGRLDLRDPHERRLGELLVDLLAAVPSVPLALPMPKDPRAARVAEAVRRAPGTRATTGTLARAAATSARTVERLFLAETGMAFGMWRKQARLHHALGMLAAGVPVTTVAYEVGYGNPSAFIAMFRAMLGTTPSRFFS